MYHHQSIIHDIYILLRLSASICPVSANALFAPSISENSTKANLEGLPKVSPAILTCYDDYFLIRTKMLHMKEDKKH